MGPNLPCSNGASGYFALRPTPGQVRHHRVVSSTAAALLDCGCAAARVGPDYVWPLRARGGTAMDQFPLSSLAAYLSPAWPGLAQVCRITRHRVVRGQASIETVYAI